MVNAVAKERWALIANPASGGGRHRKLVYEAARQLQEAGYTPELLWTTRRGHAEELANRAVKEGFTTIVTCGGDGTIHEVVNGLMSARTTIDEVKVGII